MALMEELNNVSIAKIREMMFNTIQYRDGKIIGHIIDELKGFSSIPKPVSAGEKDPQVFNPHVNSPAINSPSHIFFDDELPKVVEPFIPE